MALMLSSYMLLILAIIMSLSIMLQFIIHLMTKNRKPNILVQKCLAKTNTIISTKPLQLNYNNQLTNNLYDDYLKVPVENRNWCSSDT